MNTTHQEHPPVRLIGHRGYAYRYPENTLRALRAAADAGADAVELDIQFSRDGVPVVIHDADLQRTAGRAERVDALPWEALRGASVHEPERFGTRFQGEPLVDLRTAAEALRNYPSVDVFIEVKGETVDPAQLGRLMERVVADSAPLGRQRIIISFMDGVIPSARDAGLRAGWVLPLWSAETLDHARKLTPEFVFCNRELLPAGTGPLPDGGWQWAVYEVVSPEEARALARRGVGWVETMQPGEMRQALAGER